MPTAPWIRPAPEPSLLRTALAKLSLRPRTALSKLLLFNCSLLSHTVPGRMPVSTLKPTALHPERSNTTAAQTTNLRRHETRWRTRGPSPTPPRTWNRTFNGSRGGPSAPEGERLHRGENIRAHPGSLRRGLGNRGPARAGPRTPRFKG